MRSFLRLPVLLCLVTGLACAAPIEFNLQAQRGDAALLSFSRQAGVEVLFSSEELRAVETRPVEGKMEPEEALKRILEGSGFTARKSLRGKFVVLRAPPPTGSLRGRLLTPEGLAAHRVRVVVAEQGLSTRTDENGEFEFARVPVGTHRVIATAPGYQTLHLTEAEVELDRTLTLEAQSLQSATEPTRLAPFIVESKPARSGPFERSHTLLPPRTAVGNLDLARTENDALPYTIYDRAQIERSGVVTLNEFLQRELLDSVAGTEITAGTFAANQGREVLSNGSSLRLRGYNDVDETIILVNGRRLPEMLTADSGPQPPDVNFIPMSLVQQVQVLPVSAAALYSGNPVGGVINIVLRPDVDADSTEVVTTYNNAFGDYDAPQKTASVLHSRSLLGGRLRLRLNASVTEIAPALESELGYRQQRASTLPLPEDALYRATPNVRTPDLSPLLPGASAYTSVAPGADGTGGLAAFQGREGVRSTDFFDAPGGLAVSLNGLDTPYYKQQSRRAFFGSATWDVTDWLQLALDGTYAETTVPRGFEVLTADLRMGADNPLNPFGRDILVSLNETTPLLGQGYAEGRLRSASAVLGALVRLPGEWRASLDLQYARMLTRYRGISYADQTRWQALVDQGRYQPLRDTQHFGPPEAFYDEVLVYRGGRGRFVTLGDYETFDTAARVMNRALKLPTGEGSFNSGLDYRLTRMAPVTETAEFGNGETAGPPSRWKGRTLQRYSVFGELQAPLVPARWLPRALRAVEADLAVRYIASDAANEANVAPTLGVKADFAGGFTFRGSLTTSNRSRTPWMSRPLAEGDGGNSGLDFASVVDPLRGNARYDVLYNEIVSPDIDTESAVTQTAGFIFQRGRTHRFRATLDFVDTRKTDELVVLDPQAVVYFESLFPERVRRAPSIDGQPGRIEALRTGVANMAWRHSQHWNLTGNYARRGVLGGTLDLYARLLTFQKYERQARADEPVIDELRDPSGSAPGLLRYRATLGAGWTGRQWGTGLDAYYFHARTLSAPERAAQSADAIEAYWQVGAYVQADLKRWLPWKSDRYGLRGQVRISNLLDADFPRFANEPSGSGVQAYGDWRGRTYSVSVTATF